MITENIIYFPHHQYNVATELVKNLRVRDVINYGYIKLRDLDKWLKGETISVKMGMLSPTKDGYRDLSVVESALKRIKEQDSTACFEDEDELIPIYIFISEDTDVAWREFLFNDGYKTARKTASREGVKISRKNLSLEYAKRYNIDTAESLTLKEEKQKQIEEKEKRRKKIIKDYEDVNGVGTYYEDLGKLLCILGNSLSIDYKNLKGYLMEEKNDIAPMIFMILGFSFVTLYLYWYGIIPLFIAVCLCLLFIFVGIKILYNDGVFKYKIYLEVLPNGQKREINKNEYEHITHGEKRITYYSVDRELFSSFIKENMLRNIEK